jgi:hypothetical protein
VFSRGGRRSRHHNVVIDRFGGTRGYGRHSRWEEGGLFARRSGRLGRPFAGFGRRWRGGGGWRLLKAGFGVGAEEGGEFFAG